MTARRFVQKTLKFLGFLLGLAVLALAGLHFWFKYHAKEMLEDMVEASSKGKVKLKIEKLHFNYFKRSIRLENAVFYSTDTLTGNTAYRLSSDRIDMKVKALLPLLLRKKILIDSLRLTTPLIEVTRLRNPNKEDRKSKKDISIPEEMGKVYTSIQDALRILKVKRFQIDQGVFRLQNKADSTQLPLTVSRIDFSIDNLTVDTARYTGKEKILFSDNVVFHSHHQQIIFPDGRHRLSFRDFRINLKNKLVSFDSCTIAATKTDNTASSFRVFFDALYLANIDFDTLYKTELIKADSVYCINPSFDLEVDREIKKDKEKRSPRLENIIRQLAGDLELRNVVVNNASFNIKTRKNDLPTSFTFSNNNFEVQGLSVRQDAAQPISVKSFAMAIRNYENFIRDSSYRLRFDSVLFRNDNLTLSNFLFTKLDRGTIQNTFSIPEFTLRGLSWDDLLFDRTLTADHAIMYRPDIRYTQSARKKENRSLFQSLGLINEYMDLQQLDIVEGNIDLHLRNDLRLLLEDATLSVKSQSLLASKKLAGIRNSLTYLLFHKGKVHTPAMDIELSRTKFDGETGKFEAGLVRFLDKKKKFNLTVEDAKVEKMQVDESGKNIKSEGVRWEKGIFRVSIPGLDSNAAAPAIELKDIAGNNTLIEGMIAGKNISAQLHFLSFDRLKKLPGQSLQLDGLRADGRLLTVRDAENRFSIPVFSLADNRVSRLEQVQLDSRTAARKLSLTLPALVFTPDIHAWLKGQFTLGDIQVRQPEIRLELTGDKPAATGKKIDFPAIAVSRLNLSQPVIYIHSQTDSGRMVFDWRSSASSSNFLEATALQTQNNTFSAAGLQFFLTDFHYQSPKGRSFQTGNGKLSAILKDLYWEKPDEDAPEWKIRLESAEARDFRFDSIGRSKGNLLLATGSLQQLDIGSASLLNLRKLASENKSFRLQAVSGSYRDSTSDIRWNNAGFERSRNIFSLDSFRYSPVLPLDSFIKRQTYQADYMQVRTGQIQAGPLDLEGYIRTGILFSKNLRADSVVLRSYKDRGLPVQPGIIKAMPAIALKKIRLPFSIDTLRFSRSTVLYTEVQEKTRDSMKIPVRGLNLQVLHTGNQYTAATDSLGIAASGFLFDSMALKINVTESYADSLGGFRLAVQIQPVSISVLNPVLGPLASVQVVSGQLDTLYLLVTGNDSEAYGKIKMLYKDLKIRFRQSNATERKRFLRGLKTFIANHFILRRNNRNRTEDVLFTRLRDRSAINYLVRITINGAAASIGLQNNKKQLRRMNKQKDRRPLPAVSLD